MVGIEALGIGEVRPADDLGQRTLVRWHDHQVHVIGHQAVAQYRKPAPGGLVPQYLHVGKAVSVRQKDVLPVVPALGDVMGQFGNYDARYSGHDID
jgi:hypothetical protein